MISTSTNSKSSMTSLKGRRLAKSPMPSHADQLVSLSRIEGQVRGLAKMINDGRYCLDILNQCRSVHAALESVEKKILRRFLETCVKDAFKRSTNGETGPLIEEIVAILDRH